MKKRDHEKIVGHYQVETSKLGSQVRGQRKRIMEQNERIEALEQQVFQLSTQNADQGHLLDRLYVLLEECAAALWNLMGGEPPIKTERSYQEIYERAKEALLEVDE